MRRQSDLRLQEIREILSSLLAETGGSAEPAQSHWELPVLPPPDPQGRLSSTDLLGWWFRAPQNGRGNPWDAYFSSGGEEEAAPRPQPLRLRSLHYVELWRDRAEAFGEGGQSGLQ